VRDPNWLGDSIIAGVIYRGTRFASLTGAYIFGDYGSGNIWALTRPGGVTTVHRIAGSPNLVTFGTDPSNGDVLLSDYYNGRIMRLITTTPGNDYPTTLSSTGLFADLTDLTPTPGLLPYEPNLSFWSDYAVKRRWFTIPGLTDRMTWSRDGQWTFPEGQIWVKHFDLEMERGNPATKKRIETRVLVKNADGAYGVSYRWNDAGTEATLAADSGESFPVVVQVDGAPVTQQWRIPSRAQCINCHSAQGGFAPSFTTRQINRANTINGFTGNQLDLLRAHGYFSNTTESPTFLPRYVRPDETAYSLEARARSYLAVNCSYCHSGADGTAPTAWDARPQLTLDQTGLLATATTDTTEALVVPGDVAHSLIVNRVAALPGFTRMPPIASTEIDPTGVALLQQWISQSLPAHQTYDQWRLANFLSSDSPEGDSAFDADSDGRTNQEEYLAQTNPLDACQFLSPQVTANGLGLALQFALPENRSFQIEVSTDLTNWSLWDIPNNQGIPQPAGPVSIAIPPPPPETPQQFFRLRLWDN
jgi:hypothetical protein